MSNYSGIDGDELDGVTEGSALGTGGCTGSGSGSWKPEARSSKDVGGATGASDETGAIAAGAPVSAVA